MKVMQEWRPEKECTDKNCPYHGEIAVRGRTFVGTVIADRMSKTVSVEWERRKHYPKYERYAKRFSRIKAHNPPCIDAETGQRVLLAETRRLSKTKNFVVVRILEGGEPVEAQLKKEEATVKEAAEEKAAEEEKDEEVEDKDEDSEEAKDEEPELLARSTVKGMTKAEIKEYAKDFGVELSTNDLKKEMIDQLFEEAGDTS